MSGSRIFRGYFNRMKAQNRGHRCVLLVELGPEETAALDAQLGPRAHRSQSIPVTFIIGDAGDALLDLQEPAPPAPAAPSAEVLAQAMAILRGGAVDLANLATDTRRAADNLDRVADALGKLR